MCYIIDRKKTSSFLYPFRPVAVSILSNAFKLLSYLFKDRVKYDQYICSSTYRDVHFTPVEIDYILIMFL